MYRIKGRFQHYAWGGNTYIPSLFNLPNDEKKPFAEYWMGMHSGGNATVVLEQGATTTLSGLINADKSKYLGKAIFEQFRELPFLFKILDVKDMLSIQVHPTLADARAGFLRENAAVIPLDAPYRNYKDDNHKPEIMVALSDFWLLHGFVADIHRRLGEYVFLQPYQQLYAQGGLRALYGHLMEMPQHQVNEVLSDHLAHVIKLYHAGQLDKHSPDFWAARAAIIFNIGADIDRGIFSIYLFNILNLHPGQGIFQGAGMPHAYMEGQNIELMSNSDNVLRGGLTPKHVDVAELMHNVHFVETIPQILPGTLQESYRPYPVPVDDFGLAYKSLVVGEQWDLHIIKPTILLAIEGILEWSSGKRRFQTEGCEAVFVYPGEELKLVACSASKLFMASAG
jgi:mannose-6-phosphate isomerase